MTGVEPADPGMIRSEERLAVTVRRVPVGRAVLRRVIVVEERTVTVQVAHEEVRLEIVPLTGDEPLEDAAHGAHLALPELVLHEEQVVVTKRVVPVERVRLVVDAVTEERTVTGDVRRERIVVVTTPPGG